ncbi:hypothetical protein CBS147332_3738 [Penicillium roqueforti]|nr:hypothetical protein CBS147332_3738 [Penicillium roqueforti]KAI3102042.1 hypothetical protein CBS147331_7841 [Penicillium roqueforti]
MEQTHEQFIHSTFDHLDTTAKEITAALTRGNCRHGFIGGYAVSLVGGMRMTDDVDILVDADPADVRNLLLQVPGFQLSQSNNLVFTRDQGTIRAEILRGGRNRPSRLPDASSVPLYHVSASDLPGRVGDVPIPIVHPSVLVLTKIKRWAFIAESTRPQSNRKARGDFEDITAILNWLARKNLRIYFTNYPEKSRDDLLSWVRKLYELHTTVRALLEITMEAQDFALIRN